MGLAVVMAGKRREASEEHTAAETSPVKSAERTVRILETLAASPTRLTIAELQEKMGYPRSSLHALIRTLREMKWVEADPSGLAFGVGPHALLSGTAYLDRDPALSLAYETLEDLRAELGYTMHYARRDDAHVLYLASRESRGGASVVPRVGRRLPAHVTALGQCLLSCLTHDEVDAVLPERLEALTANTITDRATLYAELDAVRARGWAFEREQGTEGVACIAVPLDYRIPATDAISCSMPAKLADADEIDRVATALLRHTSLLAATLRRAGIR
ncbi:IclR family transcriptional regulator [Dactylosporangium sp. AC04546]|uniref:IclR family transcriptional regulator n=1 Tax=Dactylosporangium sp. AC04546 TaxID=2862460 RepID=UPI001EDC9DE2|nr:IclR family transcriptional regulator [Dactylosporangium sp. AC04546]WVK79562.1 IclR family transcriptional regulator [Dactylosporangium sp. AC04546]